MTNKFLVKLSLAVVITAMNVSLAFCQVGILDVTMRQASNEEKEVSISPVNSGETEITIMQNEQVVLEAVVSQFATISLHLAPDTYRIVVRHRLTERREIGVLQLEE